MTPFLDREVPMPRPAWFGGRPVRSIGYILAAVPILVAIAAVNPGFEHFDLRMIADLLPSYVAVVIIHELAHLLGGLASGFRFEHVRFSSIAFDRGKGASFVPGFRALISGEAKLSPPPLERSRIAYAVMIAAGPLANLATGIIAAAVNIHPSFILVSAAMAIGDLLPIETSWGVSDGGRLRMLFFDRAQRERWLALVRLPAESSDALLARATAQCDGCVDTVTAHALAYAAAWAKGDYARVADGLEVCLRYAAHAKPQTRAALISDAAVYQASVRRAPELARAWLADLPPRAPQWLRARAEQAIKLEH